MKAFNGFEAKKQGGSREILPVGGYVCEIKSAKEEVYNSSNGEFRFLMLAIDVAEGEYAGFWKKDYDGNTADDKKWRGTFRISVPKDDGTEQDGWTKRTFGNFIWAVQESNPGYVWNWDEKTLKGKKIGIIYRNREWEMNGNTGWTTEAGGAICVEDCRAGKFKLLKDRPLKNRPASSGSNGSSGYSASSPNVAADEDDLPF